MATPARPRSSRSSTVRLNAHAVTSRMDAPPTGMQPATPAAAAAPAPAALLPDGPHLQDMGELARGGMAGIRRVFDRYVMREVAMKVLLPERLGHALTLKRFVEEAQITGQLTHPNIVPVHELGLDTLGHPYFTMELVEGNTLLEMINTDPEYQLTDDELSRGLQIIMQVCQAVHYAHTRGVIHRDIKPENIMVGPFGEVFVMDWGIAQLVAPAEDAAPSQEVAARRDVEGSVVGTAQYMAPEQARGEIGSLNERTDVFALGGMVYELLTGLPPHPDGPWEESVKIARKGMVEHPYLRAPDRRLPAELCGVIMKALRPQPEERFASAQALKEALEKFWRSGNWLPSRRFNEGSMVVTQGEPGVEAFVVVDGVFAAFRSETDGSETLLREMGPGDFFGEMSLLTGEPRSASVRAVSNGTVSVIQRQHYEAEVARGSWTGLMMRSLARRFLDVEATLRTTASKG